MIYTRNIFDPARQKSGDAPPVEVELLPQTDELFLVGTLITAAESYAFFEGSRSEFNTVKKNGESINELTVTEINTTHIVLLYNSQTMRVPFGMSLEKEEKGEWKLSQKTSSERTQSNSESESLEESDDSSNIDSDDESNDILKQLMERRKKEMEQ